MLFMVIERQAKDAVDAVGRRFSEKGRMLPDGVRYEQSWLSFDGTICYQIMEAGSRDLLDVWIARWSDLVQFEVIPVLTSANYWSKR